MYSKAFMPAVGENGGVHRVSGYRMGYAVDGVSPSTGSGQHGGRLPIDVGGANTGKSKVYAGNDMVALACGSSNQGVWFFASTEPLLLVSGEICYPILECIHMTAADRSALGLAAGKTIPAGGWMYSEGTAGGASMHLHIDFGRAQDKPKAGKCPWHSIGGGSYAPDDNYPINRALFMPTGMTVYGGTELGSGNVRDNAGYIWHRDTGEQPMGEVRIGCSNYMRRTGPGTNYAVVDWGEHSADDCKALAGRLYAVYEVSDGWLRITQRGVGGENGQWISTDAGTLLMYAGTNTLQLMCVVEPSSEVIQRAAAAGLSTEQHDCHLIGPASSGDAMAIWQLCKAEGCRYFASERAGGLQQLCVVDATDKVLDRARAAVLPIEQRTCSVIGPASNGDAMAVWGKAQASDNLYFASYTEV